MTPVDHHLNDDHQREDQHLIRLVVVDRNEVCVPKPEPLSGKGGDFSVAALYDVLEGILKGELVANARHLPMI